MTFSFKGGTTQEGRSWDWNKGKACIVKDENGICITDETRFDDIREKEKSANIRFRRN